MAKKLSVLDSIEHLWPDALVEARFDPDESYFQDIYPGLVMAIRRLKGAELAYERGAEGGSAWSDDSDADEDPPDYSEHSRSYYQFFVCPEGEQFYYDVELESPVEPAKGRRGKRPTMKTISGKGRSGWTVAISLLAPFAVITLSEIELFEDGSDLKPTIESTVFSETGEVFEPETEFRKFKGEKAFEILLKLRGRITAVLEKNGIGVIPEEQWRKEIPGLRADEEILLDHPGEQVRILDALFFEAL